MITLYPSLRQQMELHGVSAAELAAVAGVNVFVFYLKMYGIKQWTLAEALKISCFFRTPDIEQVFVRNNHKSQFLESQEKITNSYKRRRW